MGKYGSTFRGKGGKNNCNFCSFSVHITLGKTGTKKKFWILDFFVLANSLGFINLLGLQRL